MLLPQRIRGAARQSFDLSTIRKNEEPVTIYRQVGTYNQKDSAACGHYGLEHIGAPAPTSAFLKHSRTTRGLKRKDPMHSNV